MAVAYYSELMEVTNLASKRISYWLKVCGVFRRVSKADYDRRYEAADGLHCLQTVSNKRFSRSYRTCTYYLEDKK